MQQIILNSGNTQRPHWNLEHYQPVLDENPFKERATISPVANSSSSRSLPILTTMQSWNISEPCFLLHSPISNSIHMPNKKHKSTTQSSNHNRPPKIAYKILYISSWYNRSHQTQLQKIFNKQNYTKGRGKLVTDQEWKKKFSYIHMRGGFKKKNKAIPIIPT